MRRKGQYYWVSQTDGGNIYADIPDVLALWGLSPNIVTQDTGKVNIEFITEVTRPEENVVRSQLVKVVSKATKQGVQVTEIPVYGVEYDSDTKTLTSDITKDILERDFWDDRTCPFNDGSENLMGIPVAAYLRDVKPYCYKAIQARIGRYTCSSPISTGNFLALALFDKADEFEQCLKACKGPDSLWGAMKLETILKEYGTKAIPSAARKFIDEGAYNINVNKALTSYFRTVTELEDGNNTNIAVEFFKNSSRLIDRRTWDWERQLEQSIRCLQHLVQNGYNSVKTLEYVLRQAFYYGEFEYPVDEIVMLRDYVNMMQKLHIENYDRFPTNLKRAHNVAVSNLDMLENSDSDEVKESFKAAVDKYRYLEGRHKTKDGKEYVLIAPTCPHDLVNEGVALNHCVSSYASLVCNGSAKILFLRDAEAPDVSLYTVDVMDEKVVEAKGNSNTDVPDEITEVLKAFEKKWKEGKK